jgi:hypothetical protein
MLPQRDRRRPNFRFTGARFGPGGWQFMDLGGGNQQQSLLAGGNFSGLRNLPCLR